MKRLAIIVFLLSSLTGLGAQTLNSLRDVCPKGAVAQIIGTLIVEGVVVSDWRSENMEFNRSLTSVRMDMRENLKTAYIQAADGSIGIRLIFDEPSENRLERYDKVVLDLNGCELTRTSLPDAITVRGLRARNFIKVEEGQSSDVILKEKQASELTDDDIYTFVTLKDMDVIFKDGSWANVYEPFVPHSAAIHSQVEYAPSGRMDGWATLLRGGDGKDIYMLVNMLCPWRRNGKGVPSGSGDVSGIIVHSYMPRYGGNMGRYCIRPLDDGDIRISNGKSAWKTYVGWMKPEGSGANLDFEIYGPVGNLFKEGKTGDRIFNDVGNATALFWTDTPSAVHIYSGYNALDPVKKGILGNGAILFKGRTVDWFEWDHEGNVTGSKAFYVSFSTRKLKAERLQFNFEWSVGTQDGNKCWYFPIDWQVQCSADGGQTWITLQESATGAESFELRSLPWDDRKIKDSGHDFVKKANFDTGLGPQQRSFNLPSDMLGQKEVLVRLSPASDDISRIRVEFHSPSRSGKVQKKDTARETWIRFESVQIDYR